MPLDWSILQANGPPDIAGNFAKGYQLATKLVDDIHQRRALGALAADPNNPNALAALYSVNPTLGAQFEEVRANRAKTARDNAERDRQTALGTRYTTDPAGATQAAIAAGDFDLAKTFQGMDEARQKQVGQVWEEIGPAAYKLKSRPVAQRPDLWAQIRPILEAKGANKATLDAFDPTNDTQLDAAITMAQKVGDLINQGKIEWHQQGEQPSFATDAMGHPIGSGNPYAQTTPAPGSAPSGGFDSAWDFTRQHEGGYNPHDGNGAPVNFGINQGANPDVDVKNLTPDQAKQIAYQRYWIPSGAADLPPALQTMHFDTYYINPRAAQSILAQSGGDPQKYLQLRDQFFHSIGKRDIYGKAWDKRTADLGNPSSKGGKGEVQLRAEAADAIAHGADPAKVNARLSQMLGDR